MKLKTRLILARVELATAVAIFSAAVAVYLARPHPGLGLSGVLFGLLLPIFLLTPLIASSWSRLRKTKAQLAELGPDAAPSADLWTAPGAPGIIGMVVVAAALFAALLPALLQG